MQTLLVLVSIIAVCEVTRLWFSYRPHTKKRYFKDKLKGVERMVYDLEFKVFKTREIREEVRETYDNVKARKANTEEQIKTWPLEPNVAARKQLFQRLNPSGSNEMFSTEDEGNRKRLEDDVIRFDTDLKRYEAQMAELDIQVNGSRATNEIPEGHTGLIEQIDSMREMCQMLKDWIRGL